MVSRQVNIHIVSQMIDTFPTYLIQFLICYIVGGGVNWLHSALRPPISLFCQPRMITIMEKLVEWLAGETEVLRENLPQCWVSTTNPTFCPDANPGRRSEKPATNRLSYDTAYLSHNSSFNHRNNIIIIIIYLNCKWVFTRWQWYYNKTHHTK
jgi:hypothetical protein